MKKNLARVLGAAVGVVLLAGCGSYTFEADPVGGYPSDNDVQDIDCFSIEADGASDEDDVALGNFCREGSGNVQQGDDD